jgi:hypothetical protein
VNESYTFDNQVDSQQRDEENESAALLDFVIRFKRIIVIRAEEGEEEYEEDFKVVEPS